MLVVHGGPPSCAGQTMNLLFSHGPASRAARPPHPPACTTLGDSRGAIESLVKENKVMLFMKGNKMFPQCGFSNSAVQVCRALSSSGFLVGGREAATSSNLETAIAKALVNAPCSHAFSQDRGRGKGLWHRDRATSMSLPSEGGGKCCVC